MEAVGGDAPALPLPPHTLLAFSITAGINDAGFVGRSPATGRHGTTLVYGCTEYELKWRELVLPQIVER